MADVASVMGKDFYRILENWIFKRIFRNFFEFPKKSSNAPHIFLLQHISPLSFNKLVINIGDNNNNKDDDDICENTRLLAYASDIDGNSFEIQQQGKSSPQVMFYEAWQYKGECRKCLRARENFVMQHSGERWLIVNRDMTGMCLTSKVLTPHSRI